MNGDVVVDASVWVRRLLLSDVHHARCQEWFRVQASTGGLLIAPELVLAAVVGAVARQMGRRNLAREAIERIEKLPGLRLVTLETPLSASAARLAAEHGLRGADAVYVATALRLGLPLVSLDQQQLARAEAVIAIISPTGTL